MEMSDSDLNDWDVVESEGDGKIRALDEKDELDLEEIDARYRKNSDIMAVTKEKRKIRVLTEDELDLEEIRAKETKNSYMMSTIEGKEKLRLLTEDELDLEEIGAWEMRNSDMMATTKGKEQKRGLTEDEQATEEKDQLEGESWEFPFEEREIEERKDVVAVSSSQSIVSCRICKYEGGPDLLVSPCHCKGTMGNVHLSCLELWLQGSARDSCELCGFRFQVSRTRRYNAAQAAWVYLRHHVHPVRLLRDIFLLGVSLTNSCLLLYMWICSLMYTVILVARREVELSYVLSVDAFKQAAYFSFFTLSLGLVAVNAADDLRRMFVVYLRPWYHWWQTTADVRLHLGQTKDKTD